MMNLLKPCKSLFALLYSSKVQYEELGVSHEYWQNKNGQSSWQQHPNSQHRKYLYKIMLRSAWNDTVIFTNI